VTSITTGNFVPQQRTSELKLNLQLTACLSWCRASIWSPWPDFCFLSDNCEFLDVGHPLWREDGSVIYSYNCFWVLPEQSLSAQVSQNSRPYVTISYETPPRSRAKPPRLYPTGTGWPNYTPGNYVPFSSCYCLKWDSHNLEGPRIYIPPGIGGPNYKTGNCTLLSSTLTARSRRYSMLVIGGSIV
jgi:hypothetical protein